MLKAPGVPVINVLAPEVVDPKVKLTPDVPMVAGVSFSTLFIPAYLKNCC